MPINDELREAIVQATRELGQPAKLSQLLNAWLDDMSQQELDNTEHARHLDHVRAAVDLKTTGEADED